MKRFTDTEKWRDSWFRKLKPELKLAVCYLFENCDNAGVWEADLDLANFCIGADIDWDEVLTEMGDSRVVVLPSGKWHILKFVGFQYGSLSTECKPHAAVLRLIERHGLQNVNNIPYPKGKLTLEDKDKDKDKETDRTPELTELPLTQKMPRILDRPEFVVLWNEWLTYRRERKLPTLKPRSIDAQLARLASWGYDAAVHSIRESIAQQWQGLFEPKQGAIKARQQSPVAASIPEPEGWKAYWRGRYPPEDFPQAPRYEDGQWQAVRRDHQQEISKAMTRTHQFS